MWLVGTLLLFAAGVAAVAALGWTPRAVPSPPLWDIARLGGTYTGILGTLGGFSVTSAIFIAGLDAVRSSPVFATLIGMLLVAFLILVFSALIYASAPNAAEAGNSVTQSLSHLLANLGGCMGLTISWLALIPLLELLELPELAGVFTWLLLIVVIAGGGWVAMTAFRLTTAGVRGCWAIPVVVFALPALYRLAAYRWPELWPASDVALRYSLVAFNVAGLALGLHMALLITYGDPMVEQRLLRHGHRVALALSAAYALAVGLTWFAVAMP